MMKYILVISAILFSLSGIGQTFPIVGRSNSSLTVQDARFSAQLNLFLPRYNDTTAAIAGTNEGNDSLGAVIFTYNTMSIWVRVSVSGSKKWQEVGTGGGGGMTNPMTAVGDLIIGGASGTPTRLAIGPNTYVLTSNGTTFSWQPASGGGGATVYSGDGVLSGHRIINGDGNTLTIHNITSFIVDPEEDGIGQLRITDNSSELYSPNGNLNIGVYDNGITINGATTMTSLAGNGVGVVGVNNDGELFWVAGGGGGGSGTVTTVSVVSANGFAGSVANATTTPAITLSTTITGIIKGNGTAISAAVSGTDYLPITGGAGVVTVGTIGTGVWQGTVVGTLYGGTGLSSLGTALQLLRVNSGGTALEYFTPDDPNLIVQNKGSGIQSWFDSGDTLYLKRLKNTSTVSWATDTDSSLLATVIDGSITYAKIQNVTQARLLGRYTASTGVVQEITIGSGLSLNSSTGELTASGGGGGISDGDKGDITVSSSGAVWTIDNSVITPAKIAASGTASSLTFLRGDGAWATPAGSGDVVKVGTPSNHQWGVWTGDGTLKGVTVTASRAIVSDASGDPIAATTTAIEMGYLNGVTSAIQTQLDSKGSKSIGLTQAADYTLTSTTSLQKLFNANGTGELTVAGNTTYLFEAVFNVTSMSSTSGNLGFDIIGAGTATATSAAWMAVGKDATSFATAATMSGVYSLNTAETGNIVTAAAGLGVQVRITGQIRINTGGTIIPSVNLTTAAAAVVETDSYFKLTPIGSGSITNW